MTSTLTADYGVKIRLLRAAFDHLSRQLWEPGDGDRLPWVWAELDQLDRDFDNLTYEELRQRLKFLYKRIAAAKGRRGRVQSRDTNTQTNSSANANAHATASANSHEVNTMAIWAEVPKETLVARGEHAAKIIAVSEPTQSKFDEAKQSIKLTFEITSGKFKSERLTKHYTFSLASKAALGQLYRRLKGETKPGERVDLETLIGHEVAIVVTHKDGEDGAYAVVQDVFAPDAETVAVQ